MVHWSKKAHHMQPMLPNDVIFYNILPRLPAKSVWSLRCVKKSWFGWITSPEFAELHFLNWNSSTLIEDDRLLLCESDDGLLFLLPNLELDNINRNHLDELVEMDYPFKSPSIFAKILGSCNGLLLMKIYCSSSTMVDVGYPKLCIWNPCTKDYITLPPMPSSFITSLVSSSFLGKLAVGFGCDSTTNDYKVILVRLVGHADFSEVVIYTTRTKAWRKIPQVPYDIDFFGRGYLVNGVVHWLGNRFHDYDEKSCFLIYFNMESEEWGKMPFLTDYECGGPELSLTWRGKLCIFNTNFCQDTYDDDEDDYKDFHTHVYVLMNKDNGALWSKMCSLTSTRVQMVKEVCFLADNIVLVRSGDYGDDSKLALYDAKGQRVANDAFAEAFNTHPYKALRWWNVANYCGSLISPRQLVG